MLKADYNRAVALCKASIDGGFDLTASHTSAEKLPFDAVNSLRRQMLSRCGRGAARMMLALVRVITYCYS